MCELTYTHTHDSVGRECHLLHMPASLSVSSSPANILSSAHPMWKLYSPFQSSIPFQAVVMEGKCSLFSWNTYYFSRARDFISTSQIVFLKHIRNSIKRLDLGWFACFRICGTKSASKVASTLPLICSTLFS